MSDHTHRGLPRCLFIEEGSMKAEIIAVGTELLLGQIVDTNSAYMAQQLTTIGLDLHFKSTVGDNMERIKATLQKRPQPVGSHHHDRGDRSDPRRPDPRGSGRGAGEAAGLPSGTFSTRSAISSPAWAGRRVRTTASRPSSPRGRSRSKIPSEPRRGSSPSRTARRSSPFPGFPMRCAISWNTASFPISGRNWESGR